MPIEALNNTLNTWIKELEHYNFERLIIKPSPNSWSLGQVYMHLISETEYFLEQARICASIDTNANEEASSDAKIMFLNNNFPNEIIEGPPTNANTPQPDSKEQILGLLMKIKNDINDLATTISTNEYKGKTQHPGLNYFNAGEWLQFADMHLRHHLRQKKRVDEFLNGGF